MYESVQKHVKGVRFRTLAIIIPGKNTHW